MTNSQLKLTKSYNNAILMIHSLASGSSWYVPFNEGGVQFVPISQSNLEAEYGNFFSRNKFKKKIFCGRTLVSRLRELETKGLIQIIKKHMGGYAINAYGLTESGNAYASKLVAKTKKEQPFFYAENPQEKKQPCNPIVEPLSSGKNPDFSTALNNKSLNKSYKSENFLNEVGIAHEAQPIREKPLVKVLHDHIVETLGEVAGGRLTREVSPWLHQAYKKLGGTLTAFKSFIESLRTRAWLRSQTWFGLKWILKFANMDKILNGGLVDRIARSSPWAKSEPVCTVEPLVMVGDQEKRENEISSHFYRSGEFPIDASFEEIKRFALTLKRINIAAYQRIERDFLTKAA